MSRSAIIFLGPERAEGLARRPEGESQIAEILGHHRWQVDSSRLKARNYTKFDSKLNKIFGAITDGYMSVPQKSLKLRKGAITDGYILESPKGEKLFKI